MSISFSGLASGMDTSSWVEALVSVKQAEITKLETKKSTIASSQETLNNIKSYFSSFQSLLENVTDSRFGFASTDLFSQNLAESTNLSVLSATATPAAKNTTYNIEVNKLATATEVNSGISRNVTQTVTAAVTGTTRILDITDNPTTKPNHAGEIKFEIDGYERTVSVDESTTVNDFIDKLYSIGIDASFNENTGVFSMNAGARAIKSDATGVMANLHLSNVNYGYDTPEIDIITTITTPKTASINSQLKHFNINQNSDCAFTIKKNNGTYETITTFTTESNLSEVFQFLENTYQIHHEVSDDGTITLTSDKFGNVFGGRLAEMLDFKTTEKPYISLSKMTSTDIVYSTQETLINRDATLGEIGAIKSDSDSLVIRKCDGEGYVTTISATTDVKLNADSTVQDLFNALAAHGITATLNDGIITLNSTTGNYIEGSIATNLGIMSPITDTHYTTAPINLTSSNTINTATSLGGLGMSDDGSVVIYSPNYGIVSVNINKELTVQGFCDKINDSNYGIRAVIEGSKVKITELDGSGSYVKSMSTSIQNALKLSVGEDHSYNSTTINVRANTDSGYIVYDDKAVELNGNTTIADINGYRHGNGKILLHMNGEISTIDVDSTLTLNEFINNPIVGLAQYGITGNILSDGKAYMSADADIYLEQISGGSEILSALKFSNLSQTTSGQHAVTTSRLSSTVRVTTTVAATNETELASLNYETINGETTKTVWFDSLYKYETIIDGRTQTVTQDSTLVFKVNDYYKTVTLQQDETFGSLIDKLKDVGINAYMTRGQFYIASGYDDVEYIAEESTSNLMEDFIKLSGPKDLDGYSASSEPIKSRVITTTQEKLSASNFADRSTKLSDLGITTGALTVYRDGQRANLDIGENETFASLQIQLNNAFSTHDLFIDFDDNNNLKDGKLIIYAKNMDGSGTVNQDVKISIGSTSDRSNFVAITGISANDNNQLESARLMYKVNDRTALSTTGLFVNSPKNSTLLSKVGINTGTFNITRNGTTKSITIEEGDTFNSLQSKINNQFSDLSISFDSNGYLSNGGLNIVSSGSNVNISVSASGDEASNIATVCQFTSDSSTSSANSKRFIEGTFKVGDADIYVTGDTTMADIVAQINASEKSLATAYWDNIDGKLVIKSTLTGASAVNIEKGDSILTEVLGLTNGNNLVMDSQTIGSNAVLTINGARYTSLSNNVKSDATGITGLTINLKGLTNGSSVSLSVKRDSETLANAVENILDRYNELISNIDTAIAKGGKLNDQPMLKLIRNNLRTAMNSSDAGTTVFRNLAAVGIKASAESNASSISTANSDITFLSLDRETFLQALENDEEAVKALLIGSKDANGKVVNEGILTKVQAMVEGAISGANGFFTIANKSYNTDIEKVNKKILNGTLAMEKYRKRLENKFSLMDTMIASMQNQYSSFLST